MASLKYGKTASLQTVTLGSSYTSGSGSMSLTSGHGARLPSSGDFWLTYDDGAGTVRVFKVTARSTDTLTVTAESSEGSGDGNISSGSTLRWALTCGALDQLKRDAGSLVLLEQQTASSSSALNFTSCLSSTYDTYKITVTDLKTSSSGVFVGIQVSINGGSSYVTSGSYVYRILYFNTATAMLTDSTSTNIRLFQGTAVSASPNLNMEITLYNPLASSGYKSFSFAGPTLTDSGTVAAYAIGTGYYAAETAIDAFRIAPESGTLSSGVVRVYGMLK